MKSIFDSSFKYKASFETDVRKTFDKIRREQLADRRLHSVPANGEIGTKVVQLDQVKKAG